MTVSIEGKQQCTIIDTIRTYKLWWDNDVLTGKIEESGNFKSDAGLVSVSFSELVECKSIVPEIPSDGLEYSSLAVAHRVIETKINGHRVKSTDQTKIQGRDPQKMDISQSTRFETAVTKPTPKNPLWKKIWRSCSDSEMSSENKFCKMIRLTKSLYETSTNMGTVEIHVCTYQSQYVISFLMYTIDTREMSFSSGHGNGAE